MAGHNARITAVYSDMENAAGTDTDKFVLGVQLMY